MTVYKTNNMEEAAKLMRQTGQTVVFEYYQCKRKIRFRKNLLVDIPGLMVKPWITQSLKVIPEWKDELMYYFHHANFPHIPMMDNLLLTECPLQYKLFERYSKYVNGNIVIYEPPTWEMHEETVSDRFPTMENFSVAIKWFNSEHQITHMSNLCIEASLFNPDEVVAFTVEEWEAQTGMTVKRLKNILHGRYRRKYKRMTPFRLVDKPDDPNLLYIYEEINKEPKYLGLTILQERNLRRVYEPGKLTNRIPKYENALKRLIKDRNIIQYPAYYVLKKRQRLDFKWTKIIRSEEAYWNDWYKMKDFIAKLPYYEENHGHSEETGNQD